MRCKIEIYFGPVRLTCVLVTRLPQKARANRQRGGIIYDMFRLIFDNAIRTSSRPRSTTTSGKSSPCPPTRLPTRSIFTAPPSSYPTSCLLLPTTSSAAGRHDLPAYATATSSAHGDRSCRSSKGSSRRARKICRSLMKT